MSLHVIVIVKSFILKRKKAKSSCSSCQCYVYFWSFMFNQLSCPWLLKVRPLPWVGFMQASCQFVSHK